MSPQAHDALEAALPEREGNQNSRQQTTAIAQAIADLDQSQTVTTEHVAEALTHRLPAELRPPSRA